LPRDFSFNFLYSSHRSSTPQVSPA
jgi:hypothetical protein